MLDLSILVAAYREQTFLTASLVAESQGKAGLALYGNREAVAQSTPESSAVLSHARVLAMQRGTTLIQVMCEADDPLARDVIKQAGFSYLTTLHYLVDVLDIKKLEDPPDVSPGSDISWLTFKPQYENLFCEALELTYQQSLDCPELTGLRRTSDVLKTHGARINFDPALWYLIRSNEQTAGVMLLNRVGPPLGLEIVYLGVVETYRGQGIANVLMWQARRVAQRLGARFITLAVDRRNHFARRMYERWLYRESMQRDAFIATSSNETFFIPSVAHCKVLLILSTLNLAEKNVNTIMPGFTHLKNAQALSFGHYLMA
ncbi:MAG: GNAT family N-acetyltransferase, partial [Phycisphaerae bacterium]